MYSISGNVSSSVNGVIFAALFLSSSTFNGGGCNRVSGCFLAVTTRFGLAAGVC